MAIVDKWVNWLDEANDVQVEWSLQYLELQNIHINQGIFKKYGRVVDAIQRMCNEADRRLFMRGMRCAWSQKKYRDGLKVAQAGTYNHVMTKTVRKQLEGIAKHQKCTLNAALSRCIDEMAQGVKQEKKQLSELRTQHKADMDQLQSRLDAVLKLSKERERQFLVLEKALQGDREAVVEDLERLPLLKQELKRANDELARWQAQGELWLKQACDWEILAKANGLEGHSLNPDQTEQTFILHSERLDKFRRGKESSTSDAGN